MRGLPSLCFFFRALRFSIRVLVLVVTGYYPFKQIQSAHSHLDLWGIAIHLLSPQHLFLEVNTGASLMSSSLYTPTSQKKIAKRFRPVCFIVEIAGVYLNFYCWCSKPAGHTCVKAYMPKCDIAGDGLATLLHSISFSRIMSLSLPNAII